MIVMKEVTATHVGTSSSSIISVTGMFLHHAYSLN